MWKKKIKKRKLQYALILVILGLSTAIFLGCISFTWEIKNFVNEYYEADQCPIYFMALSKDNGKALLEDSKVSDLLSHVDAKGKVKVDFKECYLGDKKLDVHPEIIYELDTNCPFEYALPIAEGEEKDVPGDDELWINMMYAKAAGLEINDKVSFHDNPSKLYTITAIVNSPECSSGFMDNYPCYMNSKTLEGLSGNEGYRIDLYAKNNDITTKQVSDALPLEFSDEIVFALDRDSLEMCLNILSDIFGGVGCAAALIIFGVSMIVIRYLVRATIAKEYKNVAIYKTLGRNSREIIHIYMISYLVTGLVGTLAGLVAGRPLSLFLAKKIIGMDITLSNRTVIISIGTVLVMMGMLALNIWLELRKINRITPIKALAVGTVSTKEKIKKSIIPNAYSPFQMAINGLVKNRRSTVLVIFLLSVCFYMNLMACSVSMTLGNYKQDRQVWENLPDYDGYIKDPDENVLNYLENNPDLNDYVQMSMAIRGIKMEFEGSDLTTNTANPMVYDNFTKERYKGVPYSEGRICINQGEITCSKDFLSEVNKSVGDYMDITINDTKKTFLIVGSFSAKMKGGTSFYMLNKDFNDIGIEIPMERVLFFLKDGVTYDQFVSDLKLEFPNIEVEEDFSFISEEGKTIGNIADPICILLFASFLTFVVLNLVHLVYTEVQERRKRYGVLKAMGFTTSYIRSETILRFTLESGVAIAITVLLQEFLSPVIFSLACGVRYICKPLWLTLAVCGGMYVLIMAITWSMLIPIRKISPVELMEE